MSPCLEVSGQDSECFRTRGFLFRRTWDFELHLSNAAQADALRCGTSSEELLWSAGFRGLQFVARTRHLPRTTVDDINPALPIVPTVKAL